MNRFHPDRSGQTRRNIHSHTWLMGLLGLSAGLILLIYVPTLQAVSESLLLFAGFHLVGGLVSLASLYVMGGRRLLRRFTDSPAKRADELDFGWGPEWMNGLMVAAVIAFSAAIAIEVAAARPWWPLALLATLLGAAFLVGNFIMRSFRSRDHVVLPMVSLLQGNRDLVLDAGCGAGRTTIALSRVLGNGRVVAVDRFDAGYIDQGGAGLIRHNLRVAGISERVIVERADLSALPFADGHFDSAVSTNVFDHLGRHKAQSLREVYRVLRPGGRFLMAVWVPGWPMFAVGNLLSLLLTSRRGWLRLTRAAGFTVLDQGVFNYAWFVLLERPAIETSAEDKQ